MTYKQDCTLPNELLVQIMEHGLDVVPELIRTVLNTAMRLERRRYLGVEPHNATLPHFFQLMSK